MDVMMTEHMLSPETKNEIITELQKRGLPHARCSACGEYTDLSFMRKTQNEQVEHAMCLPCFLLNHTDTDQEIIDKVVEVGIKNGWYFE